VIELKRARIWQSANALDRNKGVIDCKEHCAQASKDALECWSGVLRASNVRLRALTSC
jgi:hypothetical protein